MKKGFTLIELLAVIALIGILVSLSVPNLVKYLDKASNSGMKNQENSITAAANLYIEDHCKTTFYRQVRKTNRALHEANPRKGRKEPNRTAKRNERNVRERQGFRLWDSVLVDGKIGYISGFSGSSAYIVDFDGEYYEHSGKKQNGKTYKLWTLSKVKRLHPNGGWITK